MEEIWKDIYGYEGYYQVSSLGRIKSLKRIVYGVGHGYNRMKEETIKKFGIHNKGYYQVQLCKERCKRTFKVHRLVATAFCENKNNYEQVDHIDGNKLNNRVDNLEWVTNKENHNRKMKMGLNINLTGEKHGMNKYSKETVIQLYKKYLDGMKQTEIAEIFNVNKSTVNAICSKRLWVKVTDEIDTKRI